MLPITDSQTMQTISLARALEYTVIQSWDELMPDGTSGLIHIEYQTGSGGSTDFLKGWASIIKGSWKLVCELLMRPLWSHTTGLRFENDYHSDAFATWSSSWDKRRHFRDSLRKRGSFKFSHLPRNEEKQTDG